ncbi:DUF262 domain-containing protein [Clostridium sulfidigenes]|uniref:DUF262 domain-containing protein n=1 Tax=Clostridium sulfidigenes TaxID=318464 RepID=UPI003F8C0FD2
MKENEMIPLECLINNYFNKREVYIPLLQRNYKWSEEAAATLSQDLWDAYNNDKDKIYTIGMITVYDEGMDSQKVQLVDGQQRIVTLTLLLKYLDNKKQYFKFKFERDEDLEEDEKREYFIENNLKKECDERYLYTDTIRFKKNYNAVLLPLTTVDVDRINSEVNKHNFTAIKDHKIIEFIKAFKLERLEDEIRDILNNVKERQKPEQINKIYKMLLLSERIYGFIGISKNIEYTKIFEILNSISHESAFYNKNILHTPKEKKERDIILRRYVYRVRERLLEIKNIYVDADEKVQDYIKYILHNVEILFHITRSKPIDEFLNINKNKTRFVISDFIKTNLIIDTKNNLEERNNILNLFKVLAAYLYKVENNKIWNLIRKGYFLEEDENRLKVLFCDRYYQNNKKGYIYEFEYTKLLKYNLVLDRLFYDIQDLGYWNAYNSFNCLHQLKGKRFFEIFGLGYNKDSVDKDLEETIFDSILEDNNFLNLNYFLESQLCNDEIVENSYSDLPSELEKGWGHIMKDNSVREEFEEIFNVYLTKRKNTV